MQASIVVAACLALASSASAQEVTMFADLPLRPNIADQVGVDVRNDGTQWGRVVGMTPAEVVIEDRSGQARTFTAAEVQRIQRRGDPLSNGVRIGALTGGALGAGLGLAVDALHTRVTTVWRAPDVTVALRGRGGRRVTLGATVAW